jgi:hypothetical protein
MRWLRVRNANIEASLRDLFETYGVTIIQSILVHAPTGSLGVPSDLDSIALQPDRRDAALSWLLEKADKAERRETWNLTMEAAITILVAVSVLLDVALLRKP